MEQGVTYLSHVPIAIFFRYPLGHIGSTAYPDCPVVGVNPSIARRGRKAETERQDAQQASSPSGVADHLPPLLTRLFFFSSSSSSADQANNQTSLLAEQDSHRNTTIRAKTLERQRERDRDRKRGREGGRNGAPEEENIYLILKPLLSTWESWKFAFRVPSLSFFHRGGGGGSVRVCAPCVFARESVYASCVRAELLKADFSSPRTTRMLVVQLIGLSCGEMATAPPHK